MSDEFQGLTYTRKGYAKPVQVKGGTSAFRRVTRSQLEYMDGISFGPNTTKNYNAKDNAVAKNSRCMVDIEVIGEKPPSKWLPQ